MSTEESPADLLRRAADRLAELDGAAPPAPWRVYGQWVAAPVDACTCATPGEMYGHESGCGFEQIADTHPRAAALIVALRSTAAPLAAWLRSTADRSASGNGIPVGRGIWLEPAIALARSVLGETKG